jgi:hypothetical protein
MPETVDACSVDPAFPARVTDDAAFTAWKTQASTKINELKAAVKPFNTQNQTDFDTLQRDIFNVLACLQQKYNLESTRMNTVNEAQIQIQELQEQLKHSEEEIQIAKDRVGYIRDPDAQPSYYQSWFPMDRPMRPSSVPILVGIVVFFTMLIILALLSFVGLNISIGGLPGAAPSPLELAMQWVRAQLTLPFWVVLTVLVGILIWYRR